MATRADNDVSIYIDEDGLNNSNNSFLDTGLHIAQVAFQWAIDFASSTIDNLRNLTFSFFGPSGSNWSQVDAIKLDSSKLNYSISFGREDFPSSYAPSKGKWGIQVNHLNATDEVVFENFEVLVTYFSELETNYLGSMKNACLACSRRFTGKGTIRSILKIIRVYQIKLKRVIHIITTITSTGIKTYFSNKT